MTPERATVGVGRFDPARVFPPDDKLTYPLGVLTSWRLEARAGRQVLAQPHRREAPGLALAVVAGGSHPMPEIEVDVADRDAYYREERSITFEAEARYEGLGARPYATRVVTELTFNKDAMCYETREIKFE